MERRTLFKLSVALPLVIASVVAGPQPPAQAAVGYRPAKSASVAQIDIPPGATAAQTPGDLTAAQSRAPSGAISIDDDPYKQGIFYRSDLGVVMSPEASVRWKLIGRKLRRYNIRAHYINVQIEYSAIGWSHYEQAITDRGEALSLQPSGRDISSCAGGLGRCTYSESFDIALGEAQMRRGASEGLGIRLYAQSGRGAIITIPPSLVQALLAEME
jgi:hypothetical protein